MPDKTNQERIIDNNDKIDEIKSKVSDLPDYQDLTQQTAIQSDVRVGKTFYNNSGILNAGTAPDTSIITETVTNTAELETITVTDFINNNLKVYKDTVFAFNKNKDKIYAKYNDVLSFVEIDTNPSSYEIGCVNVFKPNCIIIRVAYTNKLSLIEYDYSDRKFTKLNEINYLDVVDEDSFTLNSIALNPTRNLIAISSTGSHYYIYEIQNDYSLKKLFKDLMMLDHTSYALKWINPYNLNVGSTGLISDVLVTIYSDLTYTTYKRGYGSSSTLDPKPLAYNLEGTYCARGKGKPSGSFRSYFCTGQITIHKCTTNSKGVTTITKEILDTGIGEDTSGYSSYSVVWFNETTFGVYRYYYDSYTILYIYVIDKSTDTVTMVKNYSYNSDKIQIYALNVGLGYLIYNPKQLIYYQVKLEGETHTIGAYINDNYFGTSMDTTATATDLLVGKTAYSKNEIITGTMPNNGALNYTPSTSQQTIPAGYTSGGTISAVTSAIDNNIQANNIKKDIEILGVTGTYEGSGGGSGDVKLFETVEQMQADTNPQDEDLAIVYNTELSDLTATTEFQKAIFPRTVTLSSSTSSSRSIQLRIDPADGNNCLRGTWSRSRFYLNGWGSLNAYEVTYNSSDGLTYILETVNDKRVFSDTTVDFGATLKFYGSWRDAFGKFIQIATGEFNGLFQYSSSLQNYVIPITQLSAIPENVYGDIFIGKQGVEQGALNVMTNLNEEQIRHRVTIYDSMSNLTPINDITNMAGFFANSSNLVNLPFINLSNVTNVTRVFYNCNNLSDKSLSTIANMMPVASQINNSLVYNIGITSNRFSQVDKDILFNKGYLDCNQNTEGWSNQYIINDTPLDKGEDYDIYGNTLRLALRTTYNNVASINVSGTGDLFLLVNEFMGCNVVSVDISNLDTSQVYDTQMMFRDCKNLKSSPDFNTSNVTNMHDMFYDCVNLTSVSDYDTSNVTNMVYMFGNCVNLTTQPNFDTSNVTNMSYMFTNCNKLTSVNNWDASNVVDMHSMFYNCVGLVSVSNLIIGSGTNVTWMFDGCHNLQSVSNLTIGATNLRYMFNGCSNLVTAPDFNTSNVESMYSIFANCTNLQNVQEYEVSNLKSLERAFDNCNRLSNSSIQNIINMCLNSNISTYKNLMNNNYSSPFSGTNITNTRYQNRWAELSEAGWSY